MAKEANKGGRQRAKDAARAADLKRRGETRTHGRCALCYRMIQLDRMHNHVATGCHGE